MAIVNLLPPELREAHRYAIRNRLLLDLAVRLGIAFGVVLAVLSAQTLYLSSATRSAEGHLESQKRELTEYADLEREAASAQERLAQLTKLKAGHIHWETVLAELASRTPSGVYLTSITSGPSGATSVTLTGSARDEASVASFVRSLKAWNRLSGVALQNVSPDSDSVGFARVTFTVGAAFKAGAAK